MVVINSMPVNSREDAAILGEMMGGEKMAINTEELKRDYEHFGFMAPYMHCVLKATGKRHIFFFIHDPRWYFGRMEAD